MVKRILGMSTKFEFKQHQDLWSKCPCLKYYGAPNSGRMGMSKDHHGKIMSVFDCSEQPEEHPSGMPHEEYHWKLVDYHVADFNNYHQSSKMSLDQICVDKSMTRWYGLGGDWINMGLPMYVTPRMVVRMKTAVIGRAK